MPISDKDKNEIVILFGNFLSKNKWFISFICYLCIGMFAIDFIPACSTYLWPVTGGVITYSKTSSSVYCIGRGRCSYLDVKYTYFVQGQEFVSNRMSWQNNSRDTILDNHVLNNTLNQDQEEYTLGKNVIVSYNPFNPSQAVLKKGFVFKQIHSTLLLLSILILFIKKLLSNPRSPLWMK